MKLSVVIPALNAGPDFLQVLDGVFDQRTGFDYEVIVVDSGSTDGTPELARRFGAVVHQIPKSEFNHGGTRNLGVSLSSGEYVVLLVQDAIPADEDWLVAMVGNLEADERVAGVYGRQIPRPGCSPLTRTMVNNWATASLERREQFVENPRRYRKMAPMRRRRLAAFDNVSSCVRRSVWEESPFEKTNFGEDLRWGKRAVESGYKIVYEPRSAVFHSHERGATYDLRRHYVNQMILLELFEARLVPSLRRLALGIPRSAMHLYKMLKDEPEVSGSDATLITLAVKHAVPTQLGTYLGVKNHQLAKISPRLHERVDLVLGKGI